MNRDKEFRRNAAEAQKRADRAKSDEDRASWLRIAQGWLSLISGRGQTEDEAFEERSRTAGTGQDRSNESH